MAQIMCTIQTFKLFVWVQKVIFCFFSITGILLSCELLLKCTEWFKSPKTNLNFKPIARNNYENPGLKIKAFFVWIFKVLKDYLVFSLSA